MLGSPRCAAWCSVRGDGVGAVSRAGFSRGMTRGAAAAVVGSRGAHHVKRGSAVGIAEARDAPAGPIFEQLRGAGRSGGAGSAVESRRFTRRGGVVPGKSRRGLRPAMGTGAGSHLRRGANLVRVELRDRGYERLGVLHGVHDLLFPCFIEGAHGRRSRRARQTVRFDREGCCSQAAREISVAVLSLFVTIASAAYLRAHTEARDCTAVARVDPPTTVDVRRSLQSPRRRRRGAAHSPSPSRLPREGAYTARSDVSRDRYRSRRMLFHFQTPVTIT